MGELVAADIGEYGKLIIRLATDSTWRVEFAQRLAERRVSSGVFDIRLHVRYLETAYKAMWESFQSGAAPRAIDVEDILERERQATAHPDMQ